MLPKNDTSLYRSNGARQLIHAPVTTTAGRPKGNPVLVLPVIEQIRDKQIIHLFGQRFGVDLRELLKNLNQGTFNSVVTVK